MAETKDKDTTQEFSKAEIMAALNEIRAQNERMEKKQDAILSVLDNIWSFIKQVSAFASGTFRKIDG